MKKEERDRIGFNNEENKEVIYEKEDIIVELRDKVRAFDELKIENEKNSQILAELFDGGIIDEKGQIIFHQNREEDLQ